MKTKKKKQFPMPSDMKQHHRIKIPAIFVCKKKTTIYIGWKYGIKKNITIFKRIREKVRNNKHIGNVSIQNINSCSFFKPLCDGGGGGVACDIVFTHTLYV